MKLKTPDTSSGCQHNQKDKYTDIRIMSTLVASSIYESKTFCDFRAG